MSSDEPKTKKNAPAKEACGENASSLSSCASALRTDQQSDRKENTEEGHARDGAVTCSVERKRGQKKKGSEDEVDKGRKEMEEANAEEDVKRSEELYWLRDREKMLREEAEEDAKLREEEIYWLNDHNDMLWEEAEAAWSERNQEMEEEEKESSRCSDEEQDV